MIQSAMREDLSAYLKQNPSTKNSVILKCLIAGNGDLFERGQSLAHVTASGWILNEEGTHALLIEHAKYNKFCPPGGHVDANETALQACLREVGEEVGLHNLKQLVDGIFDIDIHRIPASEKKNEPAHWHIDVRYALEASKVEAVKINTDECLSYKWVPVNDPMDHMNDESIHRLARKTRRIGPPANLNDLGYTPAQIETVRQAIEKEKGVVIMSGSYSRKSLTQLALMRQVIARKRDSTKTPGTTVEKCKSTSPFEAAVRSAMRSDPDITLCGKLKDETSAELMLHLVSSGHLVSTSVNASSAIDIVARLRTLGVTDEHLGDSDVLSTLMYQSLLPVVCPHCAIDFDQLKAMGDYKGDMVERIHRYVTPKAIEGLRFRYEAGCSYCESGITGFTMAAEVIEPDAVMRQHFKDGNDVAAFAHYRNEGGHVALEHGLMKAFRGEVDLYDLETRVDQITSLQECDEFTRKHLGLPPQPEFMVGTDIHDKHPLAATADE
ncbi:ATPase, T2SS/T4P/T4SS family [Pseudomonas serbica]|uniref:ATPase, T2SS/T4P/T4SS family n=1 Tax=Pseudomonas serbica TaxID=2965074 RepID=UPI00237C119C|nr:ATPase, T2SS/T4P/T4SS family [Pseudomonas serbica]